MTAEGAIAQALSSARQLLTEAAPLWQPAPFKLRTLPWEADHPDMVRGLERLSDPELEELEQHPARARRLLARWIPRLADRAARLELADLEAGTDIADDATLATGIPARKWTQIRAFAARTPVVGLPLLEWCSGKGHLARLFSTLRGQPTRCVERDERLAHLGRTIAEERELPIDFRVLDALAAEAAALVERDQLACALHACGELHLRLLRLAVGAGTRALAISPCCYHLIPHDRYQPLSAAARANDLGLPRDLLRLALQETVTAAPAIRRRREALSAWRLGFDELQREITGNDSYMPVPSVDGSILEKGFAGFVSWAAEKKQLEVPSTIALDPLEAAGRQRLARVRRLSLVRHLFRRPLETWLVLDRAQFLVEAGYDVSLGVFCDRKITPRNLMIRAVRGA